MLRFRASPVLRGMEEFVRQRLNGSAGVEVALLHIRKEPSQGASALLVD